MGHLSKRKRVYIKSITDLEYENCNDIQRSVYEDVTKRIADWCESGGSYDDDYVHRQLDYIDLFVAASHGKFGR